MFRYLDFGIYMALFIAMFDQATKWWIQTFVVTTPTKMVEVAPFFNILHRWNKGVTFGLMAHEQKWMAYAIIAAALIIVAFLLNWMMRAPTMLVALALGLVMGGALGNVIDRIRFGGVFDFLDFHWNNYHWYTFNVADAAIVCGVVLLLLESLVGSKKRR